MSIMNIESEKMPHLHLSCLVCTNHNALHLFKYEFKFVPDDILTRNCGVK